MICFCDCCHYTFSAASLPDRCPDCGKQRYNDKPAVRAATAKEIDEYERIRQELMEEECEISKTLEASEASAESKISEASGLSKTSGSSKTSESSDTSKTYQTISRGISHE